MTAARSWRQFRMAMILSDAVVVVLTYALADFLRCAVYLRTDWPELLSNGQSSVRIHLKILLFLPIVWPAILLQLRAYSLRWRSHRDVIAKYGLGTVLLALFIASAALVFERERFPRSQIAIFGVLLPATTLIARGITVWLLLVVGRRQRRNLLIIGADRHAVRLRRLARRAVFARPAVIGHVRAPWDRNEEVVVSGNIVGSWDNIAGVFDAQVVDEVLIAAPLNALPEVLPVVRACEELGIAVSVNADGLTGHSVPRLADLQGVPVLAYTPVRHPPEMLALKRGLDVIASVIGITIAGPIMLACAFLVRSTSRGPILFRQQRSGLNGRPFVMYKFRTMQPDAENRRAEIAHLNESDGPVFKIRRDPRITRIGRVLRRWSLDELPQLFNVLKGDMSIVGPRPPIPAEVAEYDRWQRRRLSMRPGLTCLWQIKGRHHIGFDEWMRLDLYYIDHWSLMLDVLIVARTIPTVLGGTGA